MCKVVFMKEDEELPITAHVIKWDTPRSSGHWVCGVCSKEHVMSGPCWMLQPGHDSGNGEVAGTTG